MLRGTMEWTIEVGENDVEYEVDYEVSPGCPETPRSYSSGGEPACGPEVDSVSVFYCPTVRDWKTGARSARRDEKGKRVRERRPELDDLVPNEEVLAYALERDADLREDAEERRAEARREARHYRPGDAPPPGSRYHPGLED